MRKMNIKWFENPNWWHYNEYGLFEINDDAPKEAKESFERYIEQCEAKRIEMENQDK